MKKVIVVFFQGGQNFKIEQFFLEIKKKFKAETVESTRLNEDSLFTDENYQDRHRLCRLLAKNSKQKHRDHFIVLAFGEKITDKRIWEVVKEYSKTATMLYPGKKGLIKVTGINENYFHGNEIVFNDKSHYRGEGLNFEKLEEIHKEMKAIAKVVPDRIGSNDIILNTVFLRKGTKYVKFGGIDLKLSEYKMIKKKLQAAAEATPKTMYPEEKHP